MLFGSAGALLLATLEHSHARVHLLLDRLPQRWQELLARLHALFSLIFYAGLLAGSAWIMLDLWHGHEESELLRIPYRPLRIAVVLVLVALLAGCRATHRAEGARMSGPMIGTLGVLILLVLLVAGTPIGVALGLVGLGGLALTLGLEPAVVKSCDA